MTISRMQNPQQLQGIGSLRQPYGLGKLVKKAFRGIKKVAKSPLGKAAILGGLGMYGMGAGPFSGGKFGAGFLKNMGGGGIGKFLKGGLKYLNPMSGAFGAGNKWKHGLGLAGLGMMAAPFIQKKLGWGPYQDDDEEPEQDWSVTPGSISNIVSMARARDPSLNFLPSSAYTQAGFYNAADGGRVGLLNGGGAGETQREQMLRAEYIKYRNQGGTMPYEQFKILVMQQSEQGQMPNQMMADGGRIGFQQGGWHPGVGRDEQGYMTSPPNNNNPVVVDTPVNNTNPVDGMVNNNLITDTPALTGFQKFKNFISGGANIRNIDKLQEHNEDIAALTTDKPGFDPNDSSTWEFRSGGRVGLQGGGGPAGGASAGGDYGGNVNPEQEYAGRTFQETYGGDKNNQGNTGGITQLVDTDLMRTDPNVEINYDFKKLPLYLQAKLHNKNLLTEDNINLEGQVGGSIGPLDWSSYFDQEGVTGSNVGAGPVNVDIGPNKELRNISFDQDLGNFNFQGNTDLENYGLGVNYNQEEGPFFAGATTDSMGNKNFNVGAKWSWGQPEQTYSTQALLDQNPDLVYGLKYGGLVGLL